MQDEFELTVLEALGDVMEIDDEIVNHVTSTQGSGTSGIENPEQWLVDWFGGGRSSSGVAVTPQTILGLPVVQMAVRRICSGLAGLPLELHRRVGRGSMVVENNSVSNLLNHEPIPDPMYSLHTAFALKETMTMHALLHGNGRALIKRNGIGQAMELILIPPENAFSYMFQGIKYHQIWLPTYYYSGPGNANAIGSGPASGGPLRDEIKAFTVQDEDVLHIPSLAWNGVWGFSLTQAAKDAFGIDQGGQDTVGFSINNRGRPDIMIKVPKGMLTTDKQMAEFKAQFVEYHSGASNAGKTGFLREGMDLVVVPANDSASQFTQARQFSREDIAMLLGIEHTMDAGSQYKSLTERNAAFLTYTLKPWMERWTSECRRKLLSANQKSADSHFWKFDASSLLKGDSISLADYTSKLRQQAVISGDEAREMHGLNPAGLDEYTNPFIATPDDSNDEAPASEPDEEPNNRSARTVAGKMFRGLIDNEIRRTNDATKKSNYCDWLNTYYPKLEQQLTDACLDLDIPIQLAKEHVAQSREELLDLLGAIDASQLEDSVRNLTETWTERYRRFVEHV